MIIRRFKIRTRLTIGFAVVLAFTLGITINSLIDLNKIWKNAEGIYDHPFMVTNNTKDLKIHILNMRRYMLDIGLASDPKGAEAEEKIIDQEEEAAYGNFEKLFIAYLGDPKDIKDLYIAFKNWKPLRDEALKKLKEGSLEEAKDKLIGRNRDYVKDLFNKAQKIIDFSSRKATAYYNDSLLTKQRVEKKLLIIFLISLILSIMLAVILTRSITLPLKIVVDNINDIAVGKISNNNLPAAPDEVGQLALSYNKMQENLLIKARVAEKIAMGKFSEKVPSQGSEDIVANSINKIADNFDLVLKQAKRIAAGDFTSEMSNSSEDNQLAVILTQMLDSLKEVVESAKRIAKGDFSGTIAPKSASDELAVALNQMTVALSEVTGLNARQNRLKTAQNDLNTRMRGDLSLETLSKNIITFVSKFTESKIGALYINNKEQNGFQLTASYAFTHRKNDRSFFRYGEGLIGQAALEKEIISFSELPEDYVSISSGLGETKPRHLVVIPLAYDGETVAIIELGNTVEFGKEAYDFISTISENAAIALLSCQNRDRMTKLLETTREQAEELQVQQEELRQTNEELESQTRALIKSEEYLQTQQEELKMSNEELEEKTEYLEKQKAQMQKQNEDLEKARTDLEKKTKELEITNKYKSEFLANMSHELRTPLNSLLILSQSLMDNKAANLTNEQVESAKIIYNSGNDLLNLINDILDLAKIESGKVTINYTSTSVNYFKNIVRSYFQHMLREKGLDFDFTIQREVPPKIVTDEQRLSQILRNLMSNAIKFTQKGGVYLNIYTPPETEDLSRSGLKPSETIAFSVRDTGIGIAKEKQFEIFEAFQQADGSISRKYGGTGLGLSITRELTKLLGGEIKLISDRGQGAEFIIFLPVDHSKKMATPQGQSSLAADNGFERNSPAKNPETVMVKDTPPANMATVVSIPDDRQTAQPNEKSMLIIEDDPRFAEILASMCREKGFKCLASATGEEGLELASRFIPKGVILDINLPGINGWDVLEHLKNKAETRHIPVHIVTGDSMSVEALNKGAVGFLTKPVTKEKLESAFDQLQSFISKKIKDLLIVEDDEKLRKAIKTLLSATDIEISECGSGNDAIKNISFKLYDCIVLDLGLPDMTGFDLLRKLREADIKIPPIVVYTGREITPEENEELLKYTQNIIIKGVKSEERLLDETALFLHRVVDDMPEHQKKMLVNLYDKDQMFRDKKVLVVDDDMRNIFALTQVLEASRMKVVMAPNGEKALEILEKDPEFDLVLMDIMMPVMDGYETMTRIRNDKRFQKLPIIALTAKAMKEDREKSLAAGANDYLSKPVDLHKLFNLMRIWLYQ
jgi:Signal transduction histidine kinase